MDGNNELARRLCAALLSVRLGVSLDRALTHFVPAVPADGWQQLAAELQQEFAAITGALFARPSPSPAPRRPVPSLPLQNPRGKPS